MTHAYARTASVALLKVMPFVVAVIMVTFCLCRAFGGERYGIADALGGFGVPWLPLLLLSSLGRGFCIWHRLLIVYDALISLLMRWEVWHSFGEYRPAMNLICGLVGVFLIIKAGKVFGIRVKT